MPLVLLCVFAGSPGFVWVGLAVVVSVVRVVPVSTRGEIDLVSFWVGAGAVCIAGIVVVGLVLAGLVNLAGAWGGMGGVCGFC